ncbi:MAG: hypothetical protein MJ161_04875 [Clostridia bacterium]|nr:hypothetical protein [Clostridia bacterium]
MNKNTKTFKIALGGICLALAVISLFGATVVPGIELTLFAISSLFTAVMIIETGVGGGALVYAGACILGFVLIPNKLALIPYVFLFGYYPILKYFIEKIKGGPLQIALKTIYFAALTCIGLLLFRAVIADSIHMPDYPVAVLIIGGTLLMLLYDFVMTFLIDWYIRRFKTGDASKFKLS